MHLGAKDVHGVVRQHPGDIGKQIRYADRRGIPYVWFPRDDGDQVKDIRSGDQVAADPATWSPPPADLRAAVLAAGVGGVD